MMKTSHNKFKASLRRVIIIKTICKVYLEYCGSRIVRKDNKINKINRKIQWLLSICLKGGGGYVRLTTE